MTVCRECLPDLERPPGIKVDAANLKAKFRG
jgi:hypothetical protein